MLQANSFSGWALNSDPKFRRSKHVWIEGFVLTNLQARFRRWSRTSRDAPAPT